jgi:hypothetical protein
MRIISSVKRAELVIDRMSYVITRGLWCDIIVLSAHASREDKTDGTMNFYEELERVFDKFEKKILIGDVNTKESGEGIFKATSRNESLHEISTDNGVRIVKSETSKNLIVKSGMFPHRKI